MQRGKYIEQRARFCQLALKDNKAAAKELRLMATGLEHCRNTSDVVAALCSIFAISERTVFRDIMT
jgi:hypothetical protein